VSMRATDPIAVYLSELGSRMGGSWLRRRRIIAEVRAHLSEAVASDPLAEQDPAEAARRAIARFGTADEMAQSFADERERGFRWGRARLGVAAAVATLVCAAVAAPLLVLNSGQDHEPGPALKRLHAVGPPQGTNLNAGRGHQLQGATAVCPAIVPATLRATVGAATGYLGLTDAQLRAQVRAGKSLVQVAGERHKSVDGLKSTIGDAVESSARDRLDAAGWITRAEKRRMVRATSWSRQTDRFVDRTVSRPNLGMPECGPVLISGSPSS
jgi:hypothetical protein